MAKRGREGVLKRQRERARQEKQAVKREKRQSRSDEGNEPEVDETRLMEEFARLSEDLENNVITQAQYDEERHRIFVQLGIESDED